VELIGRDREMSLVSERLAKRRLVTLIGPAGIGKTTLAMAAADVAGPGYELGVHVVDLTRVDSSDGVAGAIANQLGFSAFEDLLITPAEQPALVVIDNCEHVTAAAADAIAALLDACKAPTVLATSRSPLDLPDESLVVLGPLALPPANTADTDNDAVRLFLERAADAGATIGDDQLDAVAAVCRHLDGVPLAIELAAAQTRTMQPVEILSRLGEGVEVLARPRFRGDQRHRSLGATIEWSYRLLRPELAELFERLGVFAGPFTAEMAVAVGGDVGLDATAAADALRELVDASLVAAEASGDATQFRLLEMVRSCAVQRLRARGCEDEARRRLADHVVAAAADILLGGGTRWDQAVFERLQSLYDNIGTALRWCLANDDDGTRARLLCAVLWGVVHQGHTDEIADLCEQTIAKWPDTTEPFAVDAVATAATARVLIGDPAGGFELAAATLPDAGTSTFAPVTLRRAMAYAARSRHDRSTALSLYGEVATEARARGLAAMALEADVSRAALIADDGRVDEAIELASAARDEAVAVGSAVNEVWAMSVLANLRMQADVDRGLDEVTDALAAARRLDYPAGISVNLRTLAWGLTRAGRHRDAAETLVELFDGLLARSGVADVRGALYTTAKLLHDIGDEAWTTLAASAAALPAVGPGLGRRAAAAPAPRRRPARPPRGHRPRPPHAALASRERGARAAEPAGANDSSDTHVRAGAGAHGVHGGLLGHRVRRPLGARQGVEGARRHRPAPRDARHGGPLPRADGRRRRPVDHGRSGGRHRQAAVRAAHPGPPVRHRRVRGRQRLRPRRPGARRARHARRPPLRRAGAGRPVAPRRGLGRARPVSGDPAGPLHDPPTRLVPPGARAAPRGVRHDGHLLRVPTRAPGGLGGASVTQKQIQFVP
jgi:predicted ATPase